MHTFDGGARNACVTGICCGLRVCLCFIGLYTCWLCYGSGYTWKSWFKEHVSYPGLAERLNVSCQMTVLYKIVEGNVAASIDVHHSWSDDWSQHLFIPFYKSASILKYFSIIYRWMIRTSNISDEIYAAEQKEDWKWWVVNNTWKVLLCRYLVHVYCVTFCLTVLYILKNSILWNIMFALKEGCN
jgi:hypothetical protein